MTRRNIIRVMLSLLLLISQQMAMAHAMTHLAAARHASAELHQADVQQHHADISSALAQVETCEHCLAFAQIAGIIGSPARSFAADSCGTCARPAGASQPGCTRTTCVFQSRAPPFFA